MSQSAYQRRHPLNSLQLEGGPGLCDRHCSFIETFSGWLLSAINPSYVCLLGMSCQSYAFLYCGHSHSKRAKKMKDTDEHQVVSRHTCTVLCGCVSLCTVWVRVSVCTVWVCLCVLCGCVSLCTVWVCTVCMSFCVLCGCMSLCTVWVCVSVYCVGACLCVLCVSLCTVCYVLYCVVVY
jgi:hypothetical protein